ncbi:MAG: hypothetical protein U0903_13695 [Planctomycetales bacterium]
MSSETPVVPPADQPASPPAPGTDKPLIPYDLFSQVELRIATVLEAREHPNANKLLLLKIKVGAIEKQIVAGIKAHYSPESLVGTQIVIVNNLEPAMLRGEESHGMLLAASADDQVVVLRPDKPIVPGAKVK